MMMHPELGRAGIDKISVSALAAIHEAAEQALVMVFEMTNHAAIHARRVTVMPKDVRFIRDIMGMWDAGCWLARPSITNK